MIEFVSTQKVFHTIVDHSKLPMEKLVYAIKSPGD